MRKRRLSDEQQRRLRRAAIGWDTGEAAAWCAAELGVRYSASGLYKLLPKLGLELRANGRWQEASR
jgi:transposase